MPGNNNNNGGSNKDTIIGFVTIIIFVLIAFASCSSCSSDRSDVGRDPDGFLGYSDDFWEWQMKQ